MPYRTVAPRLILLLALLLAACRPAAAAPTTLTVYAAASLANAFNAMAGDFEAAHPGVRVEFNYAGSQQLAQQLAEGAPADVFASAAEGPMAKTVLSGRVLTGTTRVFAHNRLVVIYPASNPGHVAALSDLARPGLKVVLAARDVPAGQYALDALDKASQAAAFGPGFKAGVLANVVSYEENVRAVLGKVALAEADAGVVYVSDAAGNLAVAQLPIPDDLNVVADYPIAPVQGSPNPGLAQAFVASVLSPEGQRRLAEFGFIPLAGGG